MACTVEQVLGAPQTSLVSRCGRRPNRRRPRYPMATRL